jgi:PBSX family phage terminase large subunit
LIHRPARWRGLSFKIEESALLTRGPVPYSPGPRTLSDMSEAAGTIERRYVSRGAAREVFRRREREVLIAGPAGTGKSRAVLEKLHAIALHTPNVRILVVRKTLVSLTATGLVTFKTWVAAEALAARIVYWYGGSTDKPPAYIYSNGSTITVGGMDKPDKIMSSEFDIIYVQEATECTVEDWEKLLTRLRNGRLKFQQLIGDCNPQQPSHWLKKRCDDGQCVMLYGQHEDNPVLFGDDGAMTDRGRDYLSLLDALTGVRYLRLRKGQWAAAEGIVYEDWKPSVHLSDRKRLPVEWDRVWGVDFGYTNPFVWQQWAIDPDGRLWLELEWYHSKMLVEDHAVKILDNVIKKAGRVYQANGRIDVARSEWKYPRPRYIVCDHDAEDRATLEKHLDLGTQPARKTVKDGIEAFASRLRPAGDGLPRLMVLRTALIERDEELAAAGKPLGLAQEIEGYVWAPGPDGKPVKEEPLKLDDHSCDTGRYVVAQEDLRGTARIHFL